MLELIALALFQIATLTTDPALLDHGQSGWGGITAEEHGQSGWGGITAAEHGQSGWGGITAN